MMMQMQMQEEQKRTVEKYQTTEGKISLRLTYLPETETEPQRYVHILPILDTTGELIQYSVKECRVTENGTFVYKDNRTNGSSHVVWFETLEEFVAWHCKKYGVSVRDSELLVPHRYM
jgi:hypothetical protein